MFGDSWIWIIVLFLFGWGRNGFGGNGGVSDGYVLASDFANIERKLDGINNGICDSTFALNNSIKDGFSAAELARCNAQMQFMQQLFALQQQISNCCCENREAIAQVRYDMATQDCQTRNLMQNNTRDIIDAFNCGMRSIEQRLTAQEMAAKDAKIAEQNQLLFGYQLADGRPQELHREPVCAQQSAPGSGLQRSGTVPVRGLRRLRLRLTTKHFSFFVNSRK